MLKVFSIQDGVSKEDTMKKADDFSAEHDKKQDNIKIPDENPTDVAERPGNTKVSKEHADEVADEWGEESFPASDPPSHY